MSFSAFNPYVNAVKIDKVAEHQSSSDTVLESLYDQVQDMAIYSTDETVVGEWIDGTPVYRKTIESELSADYRIPIGELVDNIINVEGCALKNNSAFLINIPYSETYYINIWGHLNNYEPSTAANSIEVRTGEALLDAHLYLTIYYTKAEPSTQSDEE